MAQGPRWVVKIGRKTFGAFVREPSEARCDTDDQAYHKGWELRLTAKSPAEIELLKEWLLSQGLRAASPYKKRKRWVVPAYGRDAVALFKKVRVSSARLPKR